MSIKSFWGRYDIHAIVNENFNQSSYFDIGKAYALFLTQRANYLQQPLRVCVGRDASEQLEIKVEQILASFQLDSGNINNIDHAK
ncbi:hypothetical protein [Vampirovibrio sp.]|uniref:hypothetical protein n=1 Tax=Vampirovibrio sp. TaxID=2717857 RepID=UPI0035944244